MFCVRLMFYLVLFTGLIGCVSSGQSAKEKRLQQAEVHYNLGASYLQSNNPTSALKDRKSVV